MSNTKQTSMEMVREFYEAFQQDLPPVDSKPDLKNDLLKERINLKMELIFEEFVELVEAVYGKRAADYLAAAWSINGWKLSEDLDEGNRDVVGAADALADLTYVINGLAIEANIPLDDVFQEVHASNMSKLDANGDAILAGKDDPNGHPEGKILKGENFFNPDLAKILFGRNGDD